MIESFSQYPCSVYKKYILKSFYQYPYSIYKKYFPNGNEEEFNEAFVSFDVSEEEFYQLIDNIKGNFVCWETAIFNLSKIKTPINENIKCLPNKFREI